MFSERDYFWMNKALDLAKTAEANQEVPVGAVLIQDDQLIGQGWNQPIKHCDPTAHAEIIALRDGAQFKKNYRLINTTLYVTLEPCIMCMGAIIHARVKRLVFGAFDPKSGAVDSIFKMGEISKLNHQVTCNGGLLAESCGAVLSDFFRAKRMA